MGSGGARDFGFFLGGGGRWDANQRAGARLLLAGGGAIGADTGGEVVRLRLKQLGALGDLVGVVERAESSRE